MKNSKLKFSGYMQNISGFKSFGKFVLKVNATESAQSQLSYKPFFGTKSK